MHHFAYTSDALATKHLAHMILIGGFFLFSASILAFLGYIKYPGSGLVYLAFTLISHALIIVGFRREATFFETFIGLFMWLGFWFKFTASLVTDNFSYEQLSRFDWTPGSFDNVLIIATIGLCAFLFASGIRALWRRSIGSGVVPQPRVNIETYLRYRKLIIAAFITFVTCIAVVNVQYVIYQRGIISQTSLPYGLNGIFKWLLLFGLSSFSAVILRFELEKLKNGNSPNFIPALLETAISNVSMLSRGMFLNSAALLMGAKKYFSRSKNYPSPRLMFIVLFAWLALFVISAMFVNYLRVDRFSAQPDSTATYQHTEKVKSSLDAGTQLIVKRWVGIEGLMAVASSKQLGWETWNAFWRERYQPGVMSLYDQQFINSPYAKRMGTEKAQENTKNHIISLPGIIALLYLPGSLLFLFIAVIIVSFAGYAVESIAYRFSNFNLIFASLISQVVAYRIAHFGYAPSQSYLLMSAIILNIFLIWGIEWLIKKMNTNKIQSNNIT